MYQFIITLWILDISYSSFSRELDIPWSISYSGFKRIEFLTSRCSCHCSFFINKEMKSEVNLLIYEVGWFGIFWLVCSATFWQYCAHSACASYSFFAIFLNQVVDSWFIAWLISARWGLGRKSWFMISLSLNFFLSFFLGIFWWRVCRYESIYQRGGRS